MAKITTSVYAGLDDETLWCDDWQRYEAADREAASMAAERDALADITDEGWVEPRYLDELPLASLDPEPGETTSNGPALVPLAYMGDAMLSWDDGDACEVTEVMTSDRFDRVQRDARARAYAYHFLGE